MKNKQFLYIVILIFSVLSFGCNESINRTLSKSEVADLKAMNIDSSWGRVISTRETDFDIYKDTPSFRNWSGKTFINKGGTCLGMDVVVKHMYEDVIFHPEKSSNNGEIVKEDLKTGKINVYGYKNFREFSKAKPELVKKMMVAGHFKNYHPDDVLKGLANSVGIESPDYHYNDIQKNLALGKPAIIGIFNRTDKKIKPFKSLSHGHALTAYKSIEFENKTIFFLYDPNKVYNSKYKNHRSSAIVYDKVNKKWELYPESFKNMYSSLYTDDFVVESLNTPIDRYETEFSKTLDKTTTLIRESLNKAKINMDNAYNKYSLAIKKGIRNEIEVSKKNYEKYKQKYLELRSKLNSSHH